MSSQRSNPKNNGNSNSKKEKEKKKTKGGAAACDGEADVHICPICLDPVVGPVYGSTRMFCCGKTLHLECFNDMRASTMSEFQQKCCVLCRTPYPDPGSPEKKKLLQGWMDKGKGWAYTSMAEMHKIGEGFPVSAKNAFKLFKTGASLGDARAQSYCAICHRSGDGAPQSDVLARKYNEMAAAQGYMDAQYNLGTFCKQGVGGPIDHEKAVHWLEKAAMQGDEDAQYNLGNTYFSGQGGRQDLQRAEKFLTMAAKRGMASAQHNLGTTLVQQYNAFMAEGQYKSEQERVSKGLAIIHRALRWFHRAAAQGEAQAKMQIAMLGHQVPNWKEDPPKGGWLLHARKLQNLGVELADKREYVRAIECWVEAAYHGDASALHSLARMYEKGGTGCPIQQDKAISYYEKASDLGFVPSQVNLGAIYMENWEYYGRQKVHLDKVHKYLSLAATQTVNIPCRTLALKNLKRLGLCVQSNMAPESASGYPTPLCSSCGAPPSESNIIKNCPCHTTRYCSGKQCQRQQPALPNINIILHTCTLDYNII